MRLSLLLFGLLFFTIFSCKQEPTITTIAFGSCSQQESKNQLWEEVIAENPVVWIWGGDNIYGDSPILDTLIRKYKTQKNHPGYQKLINNTIVTGTWDDHDYGVNDGGKEFAIKRESQQAFLDFMDVPQEDKRRKQEGVYSSLEIGEKDRKIKIINLDTRYHRDTLIREYYFDSLTQRQRYIYLPNPTGDILGEAQWTWLENELTNSTTSINIINSSIQVLSEEHRYEKWANFPAARERLLDVIVKSKAKGVLIISGDRHIAEFSKLNLAGLPYPLYDFTASGLTHTWTGAANENNKHRVGNLIAQLNYGLITIEWSATGVRLDLQIKGKDRTVYQTEKISFPHHEAFK